MKKTYKTFNGENRNCFFKVGKALVKVRFTPTYTTDNEFMQKTIEESYSFKAGELQFVEQLQWLPIDRDENGFATEDCLDRIFNNLPCAVCLQTEGGCKYYNFVNKYLDMAHNPEEVRTNTAYTHYLPIPKLEV